MKKAKRVTDTGRIELLERAVIDILHVLASMPEVGRNRLWNLDATVMEMHEKSKARSPGRGK